MEDSPAPAHRRRPRYPGKYPRQFAQKYKELDPANYPETVAKVIASGKTPAGSHLPVMLTEVLEALRPRPGDIAVDCTLGRGGHARMLLEHLTPGGHLLGLDVDQVELPRTEAMLREAGFGADILTIRRSNFAGLPAALAACGFAGADIIVADLGVSSMQLDTPARGFSHKFPGPLDMRMNPERGISASQWLERSSASKLAQALAENSDEPHAARLCDALAGSSFALTTDLATAIRNALPDIPAGEREKSIRRVFQALRIEVNGEFSALDAFLRVLPQCLKPGGRAAILTFHSGEDRRVKKAFQSAHHSGVYSIIGRRAVRPSAAECRANPRSSSAKLRSACRGGPATGTP